MSLIMLTKTPGIDRSTSLQHISKIKARKGKCPRIGKGQRFMGKEAVNGNISGYWVWKHLMS